jgi:hypothetical protein
LTPDQNSLKSEHDYFMPVIMTGCLALFTWGLVRTYHYQEYKVALAYGVLCLGIYFIVGQYFKKTKEAKPIAFRNIMFALDIIIITFEFTISYIFAMGPLEIVCVLMACVNMFMTAWMTSIRQNILVFIFGNILFAASVYLGVSGTNAIFIILTFILFSLWQFSNSYFANRFKVYLESEKKMEGYQEKVNLIRNELKGISEEIGPLIKWRSETITNDIQKSINCLNISMNALEDKKQ